jgi:hypothetical protein
VPNRYSDSIKTVVQATYRACPELVPFHRGDRASQLGQESAASFAIRKQHEQDIFDEIAHRRKVPQRRGPKNRAVLTGGDSLQYRREHISSDS